MTKKRLITERDVQRLPPGSKLVVDRDTLVTPAARDLAFTRNIEWVAAGAAAPGSKCSCASCRAGASCECGAGLPELADGDYLVEVRDGRAKVRRIDR